MGQKKSPVQKHIDSDELNGLLHQKRLEAEKLIKRLQKTGQLQNGQQVKRLLEDEYVLEHDLIFHIGFFFKLN